MSSSTLNLEAAEGRRSSQWQPISAHTTVGPEALTQFRTSSGESGHVTLSIPPDHYERLFLQPSPAVGDLTKRFGNPTLLGLLGFVVPFQATMFCLCQFQGASQESIPAITGSYFFFGGIAMVLAGIGEFILGNTFPFVLFITFGCHFCNAAYTVDPAHNLVSIYGPKGALSKEYNSATGFYYVEMTLMSFAFLIATIRTNALFVIAFTCVTPCFGLTAAAYFHIGYHPDAVGIAHANYLAKIAGGFGLVASFCAWYYIIILACASTGVPCPLPFPDLSQHVFANSQAAMDERSGAGGGSIARRLKRKLSSVGSKA